MHPSSTMRAACVAAALFLNPQTIWALPQDDGSGGEVQPPQDGVGEGTEDGTQGEFDDGTQDGTGEASPSGVTPSEPSGTASDTTSSASSTSSAACNNSPSLCSKSYDEVTHMGAHNAAFLRDESTNESISGNQYFNATKALDAGLRLLQSQVHMEDGELHLCHSSCRLMDAGPLEDWLSLINGWMEENTNEVVTIILVNSDDEDAATFGSAFESAGLDQFGYVPGGGDGDSSVDWPTLQKMIDDDTRLVSFISSLENPSSDHPYLLDQFEHVFETPFEVTDASGFNCTVDRPSNLDSGESAIANGRLSMMNHFLYDTILGEIQTPNEDDIADTNSPSTDQEGALGTHAQQCREEWGQAPTFIIVDFWDEGPALDTADSLNNVDNPVGRDENAATHESAAAMHVAASRMTTGTGAMVAFLAAAVAFF